MNTRESVEETANCQMCTVEPCVLECECKGYTNPGESVHCLIMAIVCLLCDAAHPSSLSSTSSSSPAVVGPDADDGRRETPLQQQQKKHRVHFNP